MIWLLTQCFNYRQHARSASRRYLIYSEADFEVFRPAGATVTPMGVKFGREEGTEGLLRAKFHPIGATIRAWDPQKLNFYSDLTRGVSLARFSQNLQNLYIISGCFSC